MRLLLVASRFPWPPRRGNQARTVEWLDALGEHELVLVAPEPSAPGLRHELERRRVGFVPYRLSPATRVLGVVAASLRGWPLQEGLYRAGSGLRAVRSVLAGGAVDLAVVQMQRCGWAADAIREVAPGVPLLFDAIDAMGLHFRRTERLFAAPLRPLVRLEAGRCRRRERRLASVAAVTTAVSSVDLDFLAPVGAGRVVPVSGREWASTSQRRDPPTVLLSGNLGYRPTVAAARWFASAVWPQVRARVPRARWVLAGARPSSAVRRLARVPGVEVHADVPDLGPYLAAATVAVAPMPTGSGVPMKVLEAWAAGVPVVASPAAAEGLERDPELGLELAESPAEWVAALVRLLTEPATSSVLAGRGRAVWERHYSPVRVRLAIRAAVAEALNPDPGRRDRARRGR